MIHRFMRRNANQNEPVEVRRMTRIQHPWVRLVEFLLPETKGNHDLRYEYMQNVGTFDAKVKSLRLIALEAALADAARRKFVELYQYMVHENPADFVNVIANQFEVLMKKLFLAFNYATIPYRRFYLYIENDKIEIRISDGKVLLKLQAVDEEKQLAVASVFVSMLAQANVRLLYCRVIGEEDGPLNMLEELHQLTSKPWQDIQPILYPITFTINPFGASDSQEEQYYVRSGFDDFEGRAGRFSILYICPYNEQ